MYCTQSFTSFLQQSRARARYNSFRVSATLRLSITALLLTGLTLLAQDKPASPSGYVGSNVCKTCHPDVSLNFYKNPHFRSIASGKEPPESTGCESCHGPGKAHVESKGDKSKIVAFSQLQPRQVLDNCLRCHSESLSRSNIRRS